MAFPVAVIQPALEAGRAEENRRAIHTLAQQAVERGARLVVLPEACVSDIYRGAEALAETIPGSSTEALAMIAGNAVLALPLLEKAHDGKVYSACAMITRRGVQGVARKTHLYRDANGRDSFRDADVVSAGSELSTFDLQGIRIGVLMGFDAEFPEAFRALALRGADLILAALNCVEPDLNFLRGMALRNRIPILAANRLGFRKVYPAEPEFSALTMPVVQDRPGSFMVRCKGGSAIIDADGTIIAQPATQDAPAVGAAEPPERVRIPAAHYQEEAVLTASFRLDELRVQRLTSPFIAERRKDLYR